MSHPHVSRSSRRLKAQAIGAILPLIMAGCSPSGTGTVSVKDRGKLQESLTKGAKPGADDGGIKFRGKGKSD